MKGTVKLTVVDVLEIVPEGLLQGLQTPAL